MSRIERVPMKCESLSMNVWGSINIPEVAVPSLSPPPAGDKPSSTTLTTNTSEELVPETLPFSPTNSEDSGRWTGTALWPSSKYFVYGGPGFSIGILDSTSGSLERLPVPVPTLNLLEAADASNFSLSEVTCLALAGECQVWAGTEAGSLHVFNLEPGPRLSNHGYSKLPDPVLCLRTESPASSNRNASLSNTRERRSLLRTEVLVGSRNNTLTIISGEADERGSLRNVARCPRKVIQLGATHEREGDCCNGVNCICLASPLCVGAMEENYWCGCGPGIVVLRRSNWKVVKRLGQSDGLESDQCVSTLEAAEHGVWCSIQRSSSIFLWDVKDFAVKLKIPCFNAGPEAPLENVNAQVTCLVYSEPLLLVGTRGGYLLIFCIHKRHHRYRTRHSSINETALQCPRHVAMSLPGSPQLALRGQGDIRKLDYAVVCSCHCSARPVVSIHPIAMQGSMCTVESPYLSSPSHTLNMLVLFGPSKTDDAAQSMVHYYEVTNSPLGSPMTSPQTVSSTPGGRRSTSSLPPSGGQRYSLHDLVEMPKLTIHRVSKGALSYLPLQENSAC